MTRKRIPDPVQNELFAASMRICALCFGLKNDATEKRGQIAHLNKDNTQTRLDDLVWLCMEHHDLYDSTTRQTKNYTVSEVRSYRSKLYKHVNNLRTKPLSGNENSERDHITRTLSEVFSFMPFAHLLIYINDFPEFFSQRILIPLDAWELFKRSNPHIYPFTDRNLNSKLDDFFNVSAKLHQHIRSFIGNAPTYVSSIDYHGTNHKLALNKELDSTLSNKALSAARKIATEYEQAYQRLVSYIRQAYPGTHLNSYRE